MSHINDINSIRQFKVIGIEQGEAFYVEPFGINQLIRLDFEWTYAICDTFDKLLNLNVGEMYSLRSNRDDENSFMTVTRIN
jgi:hypothetical protein